MRMATTNDDLNSFHQFAEAVIASRSTDNLHELVDIWENQQPALRAQNVTAIQAAIRDMVNGDTGRPAGDVVNELRDEFATRPAQ